METELDIQVIHGSIIEVDADAIVNAANSLGYMGGGVAGYLKRVCGEDVEKEAMGKAPIPVGKAVVTSAGKLKEKFKGIIHAPTMERPAMQIGCENVKKATKAALELADQLGLKSVAIPGMGTGVGGVSKKDAAETMIETIKKFKPKNLKKVILVDIDEQMVKEFENALKTYTKPKP